MSATSCWRSEDVIFASRARWDGRGYDRSDRTGNVPVVVCSVQRSSEGRQKRDG